MLEKIFKLKENNTTIVTELIAGLTTFISISYIIFINPKILSQTGMDYNSIYSATILSSIIGTLIIGLVANVPYVQSAGLGINALFTYTICGSLGFTWQQALAMVFICGIINILVTATSIRKKLIKAIPPFLQDAITVGIGLFITYTGFRNANLLQFSVENVANGISTGSSTIPSLVTFNQPAIILALIGLIITSILVLKKVKSAYLIGIILTTLIGIPLGVTSLPDFSNYTILPSIEPTLLKLDLSGLLTAKAGIVTVFMTIFTLCISDIFDSIGTFIGTGKKSGIFQVDENGNMPVKLEKALFADSIATSIGALLGTSNVATYVESSAGIEVGGRTGLTAIFSAMCFAISLFVAPIVACVPMAAIAPVLILIGVSMIGSVKTIDWDDISIALPAFFTIVIMPFAYSITAGIEIGFLFYAISNIINKKYKNVSIIIYIFSLLFIIDFIYSALA
ncbi:MAG: NCS2 family permease [Clostridia bacterium]|nr:NCS2 family permease [Clostridia bacterium]